MGCLAVAWADPVLKKVKFLKVSKEETKTNVKENPRSVGNQAAERKCTHKGKSGYRE